MADNPPTTSSDAAGGQSTRQLLEELDALMQRMLALPVEPDDERPTPKPAAPAPAPAASPRSVGLMPLPPAPITVQPPVADKQAQFVVGRESQPMRSPAIDKQQAVRSSAFAELDSAPTYLPHGAEPLLPILLNRVHANAAQPANMCLPTTASTEQPTRPEPLPKPRPPWAKSPLTAPPPTAPAQLGSAMLTLLAFNRIFDRSTTLFGGVGRWLRGDDGRLILGWLGIAMLAIALIWFALEFLG
jgi:hypothetical protein